MLRIPDTFVGAFDLSLDDDAITHVFVRDSLVLFGDSPGAMPWRFYRQAGLVASRVHAIGRHNGHRHLAVALPDEQRPDSLPHGLRAAGLRNWYGVLDDASLAIAMRGVQIVEWDRTHRYCGACGTATERLGHERARRCPVCLLVVYPRISPAMMVLVTRGRELLLGRGVHFPPGRYSALAGFLEAGESVEQAVVREVREEVGVEVRNLRYFSSQSWPFPNSLMIAFTAEYAGGRLQPDPAELADARWFPINDLPDLPPPLSIARDLIDATAAELAIRR
ncbi:MAG: NAD(+) diphosphatase [Burkholderiaceae bacterium]|jgi:NAD+ diphosphatase